MHSRLRLLDLLPLTAAMGMLTQLVIPTNITLFPPKRRIIGILQQFPRRCLSGDCALLFSEENHRAQQFTSSMPGYFCNNILALFSADYPENAAAT